MHFASAVTTAQDVDKAKEELVAQICEQLDDQSPDLVLVFLSPHFTQTAKQIVAHLQDRLTPKLLLGCTGESVIGRDQELENKAAITMVAASLPRVYLTPFVLEPLNWPQMLNDPIAFRQEVALPTDSKLVMMLADPFSTPIREILAAFNTHYPQVPVIGGMASGSQSYGGNVLIHNQQLLTRGAVGVALGGAVDIDIIVSQGCRPIGTPFMVSAAQENVIYGLEDKSPLIQLQELIATLSEIDRALLSQGLFVGRAIERGQDQLGRGDFLVRGVTRIDQASGALTIGDYIQPGEIVQFHVRDASTALEDLEMMLTPQTILEPASGGFLFSCNGRGTRLYDHPHVDISTIQNLLGGVNMAGFFCAGEIGPVGDENFLHGHTASLALFRPQP